MQHAFYTQIFVLVYCVFLITYQANASISSQQFFLTNISFTSDTPLSKQEFAYLTDLYENTFVSKQAIEKAYKILAAKNKFREINISLAPNKFGQSLHISLIGHWLINKVSCKGIPFGKADILHKYAQQAGDIFNPTLHEESLRAIKQYLDDDGYFQHEIDDVLLYHQKTKRLSIILNLLKHARFSIANIKYDISQQNSLLQEYLHNKITPAIKGLKFSKTILKKQVEKIKLFLKKQGYINSKILIQKAIKSKSKKVFILLKISLGKKFIATFKGNKRITNIELKKNLSLNSIPDWLLNPALITERIVHEYFKKGYWETEVQYKKTPAGNYIFFIKENAPTFINNIKIIDIQTLKKESISLYTKNKHILFDQQVLYEKLQQLENLYYSSGFWDFTITQKRYLLKQKNQYDIVLLITKGKQKFLNRCHVQNFSDLEDILPYNITSKVSNTKTPFNNAWLQQQKLFLINHFQNKGYWNVKVTPYFATDCINDNQELVTVTWHIQPGSQSYFGKILIHGNTTLPFKRILPQITFKEGEFWNKEKIEQTRKRLKRFDLFKQVHIHPSPIANINNKPINITLIEDEPVEFRLRAGYFLTSKNFLFKRQSTPKLGGSVVLRNPTNHADKITLESDISKFERKSNITYQQPFFLNLPAIAKLQGYTNKYVHPVQIASSASAYEAIQSGILCSLSNEYKNNYYWALTIGNEWQKTSQVRGNLKLHKSVIDTTIPYLFIEPSFIIDSLDDKINTSKGTFSFISLKCMIPNKLGNFTTRLMAEQSLFYPLYKKLIFAIRLRLGHIFKKSFEYIMPIDRFYLGGPYSVRGYEKDALPPLGETIVKHSHKPNSKEFSIQGGSSMINTNIELRIPVMNNFGFVLFQDIGALSQSGFLGFKEAWYPTSGLGLRYKTPIGSLRFDIGWKWKKKLRKEKNYAWYLTLGEAF